MARSIFTEVQFYCEAATSQAGTIPPDFILRVSNRGEKSSQGWVSSLCLHPSSSSQIMKPFTFNVLLKIRVILFDFISEKSTSHLTYIIYQTRQMYIYQLYIWIFCSKAVTILSPKMSFLIQALCPPKRPLVDVWMLPAMIPVTRHGITWG